MVTPTLARAAALAASPFLELPTRLVLIRHGQAMHNPRAEAARAEGCSFERFFDIMKEDDAFDAPLTELGKDQAQRGEARLANICAMRSCWLRALCRGLYRRPT